MAKYSKGVLYKKILDEAGNVIEKVPFLLKTLGKLVVLDDGTTVQDKVAELENRKTYLVYDTYAEYKTAYDAGEIPDGTLTFVKSYY